MQQYNAIQYKPIQDKTTQHNTIQYNSIQYMLFLNMYNVVDEAAESITIKHKHPSTIKNQ